MVDGLFTDYLRGVSQVLKNTETTNRYGASMNLDDGACGVVRMVVTAREYNKKAMVIGNGGSSAIASHLQNDLGKAVGLRALCFSESSLLTALANDHGYGCVYERQVEQWAEDGDLLIAISSSGNSENILRGVEAAVRSGCGIVTLSGFQTTNRLRSMGDINFYVPVMEYGLVETAHAVLGHYFTDSAVAACAVGLDTVVETPQILQFDARRRMARH